MSNLQLQREKKIALIQKINEDSFRIHSGNCSGFVKEVARKINIYISAIFADGILNELSTSVSWKKTRDFRVANQDACDGKFVIAGVRSQHLNSNHGHVVIIVPKIPSDSFAAYGSWGTLNSTGYLNQRLTRAFRREYLPLIEYFSKDFNIPPEYTQNENSTR